jgi:hypothetical protein
MGSCKKQQSSKQKDNEEKIPAKNVEKRKRKKNDLSQLK